jgi:hypothetical protein
LVNLFSLSIGGEWTAVLSFDGIAVQKIVRTVLLVLKWGVLFRRSFKFGDDFLNVNFLTIVRLKKLTLTDPLEILSRGK